jgi:DNA transformation protein
MIGLVSDGDIYLKADETSVAAYRNEGMTPFTYAAKGRRTVMSYWRMPDRLLDYPEELAHWARAAQAAAQSAAAGGGRKRRKQNAGR